MNKFKKDKITFTKHFKNNNCIKVFLISQEMLDLSD